MIEVAHLRKWYRVHRREPGLAAALRSLIHRPYEDVKAVEDVSFSIAAGERVGFLGPNGAGKTTTLKVLAGLLHPTRGEVAGRRLRPQRARARLPQQITLVMGQKQQLLWDLPPSETFALNRAIYDIPRAQFDADRGRADRAARPRRAARQADAPALARRADEVRAGGRAAAPAQGPLPRRADHRPRRLDAGRRARASSARYNERIGATVLLTSHYMDDVAALCPRVMVIDKGRLIYDGGLPELVRRVRPDKRVILRLSKTVERRELEALGTVVEHRDAAGDHPGARRKACRPRSRAPSPRCRCATSRWRIRRSRT